MLPEFVPPLTGARAYFMTSERLGFGTWTKDDEALATAIWGDPDVMKLIGGSFEPWQVRERLAFEITNLLRYGIQYWPLFRLDTD